MAPSVPRATSDAAVGQTLQRRQGRRMPSVKVLADVALRDALVGRRTARHAEENAERRQCARRTVPWARTARGFAVLAVAFTLALAVGAFTLRRGEHPTAPVAAVVAPTTHAVADAGAGADARAGQGRRPISGRRRRRERPEREPHERGGRRGDGGPGGRRPANAAQAPTPRRGLQMKTHLVVLAALAAACGDLQHGRATRRRTPTDASPDVVDATSDFGRDKPRGRVADVLAASVPLACGRGGRPGQGPASARLADLPRAPRGGARATVFAGDADASPWSSTACDATGATASTTRAARDARARRRRRATAARCPAAARWGRNDR